MNIDPHTEYAILTGDLIGFSQLSKNNRLQLQEKLRECTRQIRHYFPQIIPLDIQIFRGDGWQLLISKPDYSLRIGLLYRAFIRSSSEEAKLDTRVSIGIGTIDYIPQDKVTEGDGKAFRLSGRALEDIQRSRRLVISPESGFKAINIIVRLIDELAMKWTYKQAKALCGVLFQLTQEQIAESWEINPISQQAVAQHLQKAGWNAIEQALIYFEDIFTEKSD